MKVTIVCDVLGEENNGTTIATMNLIRSLKSKGHEVRVICPDENRRGEEGFYVVPLLSFGPLNEYVRKNGVVIAKADKTVICEAIDGVDIVHIMIPFSLGRKAAKIAKEKNIPVSAGFHAMAENLTTHIFMKNFGLVNRLTYSYYHGMYKYVDAIHYPTQYLRDLYEKLYGKTNGYVISNGVSSAFHKIPTEKPEQFKDKFVILFTGRYSGEKSHDVLIDAVALSEYKDKIQLIFAGAGPKKEKLEKLSQKLPVKPVFAFFSRDDMIKTINYSDLYVHPAEIEAEGIACLEAISCGLVPVISDSPRCATKMYALDDMNKFIYNKPADLAKKIDYWISHPDEKAKRSAEYEKYAQNLLSLDACMDRMEQMLTETAGMKARS